MLYEADRHEPLTSTPWNESAVKNCVEEIARDVAARYLTRVLWPSHPLEFSPDVRWNLYVGAAGVIWALNGLASSGVSIDLPDISKIVRGLLEPIAPGLGVGATPPSALKGCSWETVASCSSQPDWAN
jgi:hypothetical protein